MKASKKNKIKAFICLLLIVIFNVPTVSLFNYKLIIDNSKNTSNAFAAKAEEKEKNISKVKNLNTEKYLHAQITNPNLSITGISKSGDNFLKIEFTNNT